MPIKSATPYLFFNGNATDALSHYQRALGAEVDNVMRYGDVPGDCPEAIRGKVMHALVKLGSATLMVSDAPPNMPVPPTGNVDIAVALDDLAETTAKFDALAAGGQVLQPLMDAFWGDKFGVLKDKFGIGWMFTCPLKK